MLCYLCVCVFKSNSKFLERPGEINKKTKQPRQHSSKLEAPLCQGYTLQILKHLAAKPFIQMVIYK